MGLQAGKLDHQVTIRRRSTSVNEANEPIESWADLVTTWASVEYKTGAEFNTKNFILVSKQVAVFTIRYYAGITVMDRVKHSDGNEYAIVAVSVIGRNEGMQLTAEIVG